MARKRTGDTEVERAAERRMERYSDAEADPASVLSRRQLEAVRLIAAGKSDTEVAEAVGVDAGLVMRWRTKHPAVKALVNRAGTDQLDRMKRKVRALVPLALDRLEKALDDPDDGLKAALALVRLAGLERRDVADIGSTDVEGVLNERRPLTDLYDPFLLEPDTAALLYGVATDGLDDDDGRAELPDKAAQNGHVSARPNRGRRAKSGGTLQVI